MEKLPPVGAAELQDGTAGIVWLFFVGELPVRPVSREQEEQEEQ